MSFKTVKEAIINNMVDGGEHSKEYHLMMDASLHALGGVVFLYPGLPERSNLTVTMSKKMKILM